MEDQIKALQAEIDRVEHIPDEKEVFNKLLAKARMAVKSKRLDRVEQYLALLKAVRSDGSVTPEPAPEPRDRLADTEDNTDAASDE